MRATLVVTLISAFLASCSDKPEAAVEPRTDGPLRTNLDNGGNSIAAPARSGTCSGTYGGLLLCSIDGSEIRITDVRYSFELEPLDSAATMRFVDEKLDGARTMKEAPRITDRGTVEDLFPHRAYAGDLGDPIGTEIADDCTTDPNAAYHELLTTLTVDDAGGWVDGIDIRYEADDRPYALHVNWNYVACGSAVHDRQAC